MLVWKITPENDFPPETPQRYPFAVAACGLARVLREPYPHRGASV